MYRNKLKLRDKFLSFVCLKFNSRDIFSVVKSLYINRSFWTFRPRKIPHLLQNLSLEFFEKAVKTPCIHIWHAKCSESRTACNSSCSEAASRGIKHSICILLFNISLCHPQLSTNVTLHIAAMETDARGQQCVSYPTDLEPPLSFPLANDKTKL